MDNFNFNIFTNRNDSDVSNSTPITIIPMSLREQLSNCDTQTTNSHSSMFSVTSSVTWCGQKSRCVSKYDIY